MHEYHTSYFANTGRLTEKISRVMALQMKSLFKMLFRQFWGIASKSIRNSRPKKNKKKSYSFCYSHAIHEYYSIPWEQKRSNLIFFCENHIIQFLEEKQHKNFWKQKRYQKYFPCQNGKTCESSFFSERNTLCRFSPKNLLFRFRKKKKFVSFSLPGLHLFYSEE